MPPNHVSPWSRAIILVDMNAFFASIEQRDFPELRGRPVAVTNGEKGASIITASYEARARGVKTGMHIRDARKLCPDIVKRASRPKEYAQVSTAIMAAMDAITPDVEVFSVDEAFLDVTGVQHIHGTPEEMGQMAKRLVHQVSGLACSIGISGDKTTAKYAAKLVKPDGFTVIPPWEAKERLRDVPLTELCGIKGGIGSFLAERGVHTCGDMQSIPVSVLAGRFGNLGRRIWLMAQG
ncbi:MAG: DNA polymerase IV, partial [Gammaproteobacteria bacterium]